MQEPDLFARLSKLLPFHHKTATHPRNELAFIPQQRLPCRYAPEQKANQSQRWMLKKAIITPPRLSAMSG